MGTLGRAIHAAGRSIRGAGRATGRRGSSTVHGAEEQVSIQQRRTAMSVFERQHPRIKKDAFVAPSAAAVTGDAQIGHAVLRASNPTWYMTNSNRLSSLTVRKECPKVLPPSVRPSASYSTKASENKPKQERTDLTTIEDPFDAPTYNIPEKPVTFVEGASYSVAILAGLGVAALAGYAVMKELIFEPKEYKIFGKVLARVQSDSQVTAKIGYPITGYGAESRNRAARQRIPNRVWTDEDGVEHVEVNFYVRGPHGAGKVFAEMFKDSADRTWKFTFLVVEITSPRHAQLMLESYVPA